MQIVTYLSFTLLSVFIQFSVIDFIQGRLKLDDKAVVSNGVSQKRQLRDVLKEVTLKPHALFYHTQKDKGLKYTSPAKFISNITLTELLATTDMTTTVFDILYDENTSSTEESFSTESLYTDSDIENVTEITFFEKSNDTGTKTDTATKKTITDVCSCNLMLKMCDVNCCCDTDCLDTEKKLFPQCAENKRKSKEKADNDYCVSQLAIFGYENGLFCIVKVNLPEKPDMIFKKTEPILTNNYLLWRSTERTHMMYEFSNLMYNYGDPVWLYKNGTIYHMDLPVPTVNNYCTGRKVLQFLKDENYKCNVKIGDLEMFQITKSLEEVTIISATPLSMNNSVLNCSSLHCVNWTTIVCESLVCTNYAQSLHEPTCTENICKNLAHKIHYIFHYQDFIITNATVKFHLKNMTMNMPYISQEIQVQFLMGNESLEKILKLSGNPGYLVGLPLIISNTGKNYTDAFFNTSIESPRHLALPENRNGFCSLLTSSENYVLFGRNRRTHCRYNHKSMNSLNATGQCKSIQKDIQTFFKLKDVLVSPLGNPFQLKDDEWVPIEKSLFNGSIKGIIQDRSSKLLCFNLVSRCSLIFGYAQVNGNNRILSVNFATTAKNSTFNLNDIYSVITIDISFVDVTSPSYFQYVTQHPSVNLHLPDNFFYPFRSNKSQNLKINVFSMVLYFITYFLQIK